MGAFTAGDVVLVRFPFSDLSQTKLRPAIVLARQALHRHVDLVAAVVGTLRDDARERVVSAVVQVLQTGGMTERR